MPSQAAQTLFDQFREANANARGPVILAEERKNADAAGALTVEPEGVTYDEVTIAGLRTIRAVPHHHTPERQLIFIHGGAFALMSPESHQRFAGHIAVACRAETFIPEYSLAPEYPFPKALEETVAFIRSFTERDTNTSIILAGDSAGAGLALGAVMSMRDQTIRLPACTVLLCPWLDLALEGNSVMANKDRAVILRKGNLEYFADCYLNGADPKNPLVSPLYGDLNGLTPIYVQAAELDLLLDDSTRLAKRAAESGVDLQYDLFPEMVHSFQFFAGQFPEADAAIKKIGTFVDIQLNWR